MAPVIQTNPFTSRSSGSAVLLEPESSWPAEAFAATADCDRIVILHADPNASISQLADRIAIQVAEFERQGSKLRSIILACARFDQISNNRRLQLVKTLLSLLTSGEGRLVLATSQSEETVGEALRELALSVASELQERSIVLVANDKEINTPTRPARKDSGVFSIQLDDYNNLVTNEWQQNADFAAMSAEAT
jgi:hypothetical protein